MTIRTCMKRNVVSIPMTATIGEAAELFVRRHIGLLPIVDQNNRIVGVLGMRDLLKLSLPSFFHLVEDFDFVHDFGAVETRIPDAETLSRSVTSVMRPATTVTEDSGLLRAYALLLKHQLHDLPVINDEGVLTGIASRVDIGSAILTSWLVNHEGGQ